MQGRGPNSQCHSGPIRAHISSGEVVSALQSGKTWVEESAVERNKTPEARNRSGSVCVAFWLSVLGARPRAVWNARSTAEKVFRSETPS